MGSVSASVTSVQKLMELSPSVPETHSDPGDLRPSLYGDYIIRLMGQRKHLKGKDFNDYLFLFKIQVNSDRLKKRPYFLIHVTVKGPCIGKSIYIFWFGLVIFQQDRLLWSEAWFPLFL